MNTLIKLSNILLKFLYINVFKNYSLMIIVLPFIISIFISKVDRDYKEKKEEAKQHKEDVLKIKDKYKGVPEAQVNQKIEEYYQDVGFNPIPELMKKMISMMVRISIVLSLINPSNFLTEAQLNSPNQFLGFTNVIIDEMDFNGLIIYVGISTIITLINTVLEKRTKLSDIKINKDTLHSIAITTIGNLAISSLLYWVFTKNVSFHIYSIALSLGNTASLIIRNIRESEGGDINE